MKTLLFLSLLSLSSLAWSLQDWKVIAETPACDGKIEIMAREGERYVVAVKGAERTKLFSKDGSPYTEQSLRTTEFASENKTMTFTQPSYVENNLPKIDVGTKRCKMHFAR